MDLKIIPGPNDNAPAPEPWPHEFDTVKTIKESGKWPLDFLSAYGMMPYLKRHGENLVGIEIGVLKGENIVMLLEELPNIAKIIGIDPFVEHTDQNTTRSQEDMDKYAKIAAENLKPHKKRYVPIKKSSADAAADIDDESVDFVLLDGDHSYEGIKADLTAYYPKLKKGGHMFIHDCYSQDVLQAIHEYRDENRLRMPLNMSKNFVNFWTKA